jgi:hypothetical protein
MASTFRVEEQAKQGTSMKQAANRALFHAGFLLDLLFNPENDSNMFLRNAGCLSPDYMALYTGRENSS